MTDDIRFPNDEGIAEATAKAQQDLQDFESDNWTAVIITTGGDTLPVLSIDLTDIGALYVYTDHSTNLMPWHMVARVLLLDEPTIPEALADLPVGHEGSE